MTGKTNTIPEHLTPDQLRREAAKRELRDRAQRVEDRREARNRVVDGIMAIPADAIDGCGAHEALKLALGRLLAQDKEDRAEYPTNGEINLASVGSRWWDDMRPEEHHELHEVLDKMECQRGGPSWR